MRNFQLDISEALTNVLLIDISQLSLVLPDIRLLHIIEM